MCSTLGAVVWGPCWRYRTHHSHKTAGAGRDGRGRRGVIAELPPAAALYFFKNRGNMVISVNSKHRISVRLKNLLLLPVSNMKRH